MKGIAINSFNLNGTSLPLIWGGDAANYSAGAYPDISKYCYNGDLSSYKVQGKIVFCEGAVVADSSITDVGYSLPLPATIISVEDGLTILNYIRSKE